jgi:hypothetical protein
MANQKHLIGLLLGAEEDWPTALEALDRRTRPDHRHRTARGTRSPRSE